MWWLVVCVLSSEQSNRITLANTPNGTLKPTVFPTPFNGFAGKEDGDRITGWQHAQGSPSQAPSTRIIYPTPLPLPPLPPMFTCMFKLSSSQIDQNNFRKVQNTFLSAIQWAMDVGKSSFPGESLLAEAEREGRTTAVIMVRDINLMGIPIAGQYCLNVTVTVVCRPKKLTDHMQVDEHHLQLQEQAFARRVDQTLSHTETFSQHVGAVFRFVL